MKIGYARISTSDQKLNMQIDALKNIGCKKIYEEVASGSKTDRPVFNTLLKELREGDTVVVWKIDRLGRSLRHLVETINMFHNKGIGFQSLNDPIDTTTPQGRLTFNIFASLAEFEREMIRERTRSGLASAKARGRSGGRPKGLSKESEAIACAAETLYKEGKLSAMEIAKRLNISKVTLYAYLRYRGVAIGVKKT